MPDGKTLQKFPSSRDIFQLLDANLNRAREGLRVCEETARFLLKDPSLTRRCQRIRYELRKTAVTFPKAELLRSRDSARDVGRPLLRGRPSSHRVVADLVLANSKRVQEALRVLEEFSRILSARQAVSWGSLRFRVYRLEKDLISKLSALRHR